MATSEQEPFAALLRRRRRAGGLTQQELADRSGVSLRAISDLEREINQRPRRDTAEMLAAGLTLAGAERAHFLNAARRRRPGSLSATLPSPAGPIVGRADALALLEQATVHDARRLVTLTGPGGVGKTTLALEVARRVAHRFAAGALFVPLDGISDPAQVMPALARALKLRETGNGLSDVERIAVRLADLDVLIVLDNMEHLLPAAAEIAALLDRCPSMRAIVTSQESLRLGEERVFTVVPLPRPEPAAWQSSAELSFERDPAVALFVWHALAARADLDVDPETAVGRDNLALIAEICNRLDGLPLAIELAAAQLEVFSLRTLLTLLQDAGVTMLAGGRRDQPARLRTMDAALRWSYDLLAPRDQAVLRALSVFAGGFTHAAASAVVADGEADRADPLQAVDSMTIAAIGALAKRNLLIDDTGRDLRAGPRLRMLEPIRLFARERLEDADEAPAARRRHAAYFAAFAEAVDALTLGPAPERWLPLLEADLENVRAAQDWALASGEPVLAVRIVCAVAQHWELKGLITEGRHRVATAIGVADAAPPELRWFLRFWAATFALDGDDLAAALAHADELLAIAEAHAQPLGVGVGLATQSRAIGAGPERHRDAAALARRAVEILTTTGRGEWSGWAWSRLGIELHRCGELAAALEALRQGLSIRRQKPCSGCVSYSLASLGAVLADLGQPEDSRDHYLGSLTLAVEHENLTLTLAVLLGLADTAWRFGNAQDAAGSALLLFGAAEAVRLRHGLGTKQAAIIAIDRWLVPIRNALGESAADEAIAEGSSLPLAEIAARVGVLAFPATREQAPDPGRSLFLALGSIE
jgi:predicted ATPase/DNA-binding XRE family transcriptional regulator